MTLKSLEQFAVESLQSKLARNHELKEAVLCCFIFPVLFIVSGENYKPKEILCAAQHRGCLAAIYMRCCWFVIFRFAPPVFLM